MVDTNKRKEMESVNLVNDLNNDQNMTKLLCKFLSKENLSGSSSLIIVVSSKEFSSDFSMDRCSSTICIQMSENLFYWSNKSKCIYQNPKEGFKINTKEKTMTYNKETKNSLVVNEQIDKVCQMSTVKSSKCRVFSNDTTQDRPCCCQKERIEVQLYNNKELKEKKCVRKIVSKMIAPLILKQATEQGLSHENYENMPIEKYPIELPKTSVNHSNLCNQTPVRLCKIPPCSGLTVCHPPRPQPVPTTTQPSTRIRSNEKIHKPCDCSLEMLQKILEKTVKQMVSKSTGNSKENLTPKCNRYDQKIVNIPHDAKIPNTSCSNCNVPNLENEKMSCMCSGKEKKLRPLCPCQQHSSPSHEPSTPYHDGTTRSDAGCQCKNKEQKKKYKNVICECPEEEEPEFEYNPLDWIDERQIRKIKSDLTQTMSGFKLNIPKKRPPESEMSFEELLKYFADHPEKDIIYDKDKCSCAEEMRSRKKKSANIICECPYEPPPLPEPAPLPEEEPFTGIKFHIGGKGSGSKGLSGILCFELFDEQKDTSF